MKRGRSLERLVALIEERLAASPEVKVESPGFLPDRVTGKPREHDVLITVQQSHHQLRIALECRDRNRKVGVPEVEAFSSKCSDTGVNQGVIVSPSGFYNTAITKARHSGITCLTLSEAERFQWLPPSVGVVSVEIKHTNWTVIPANPPLDPQPEDFAILDSGGDPVTADILNANVIRKLNSTPLQLTPGPQSARFIFRGDGLSIRDNKSGQVHPLATLLADTEYDVHIEFAPFQFMRYAAEGSTATIAEAAVAEFKRGQLPGQFVAVRGPSGEATISFIREVPQLPKPASSA
jgi:hypothetical protein